jgi:hypothetical protein
MRIYTELPCGCLVSEDGGGGLIPCCYPEIGQKPSELHKQCMKDYFKKSVDAKKT